MIKTLLNADEEPPPGTKVVVEETVLNPPAAQNQPVQEDSAETLPAQVSPGEETPAPETVIVPATESFEIPKDAEFFNRVPENSPEETAPANPEENTRASIAETTPSLDEDSESLEALMSQIENLEPEEFDRLEAEITNAEINEPAAEAPAAPLNETPVIAENIESPVIESEKSSLETPEIKTAATPNNSDWLGKPDVFEETAKASDAPGATIFQSDYTPPTTAETIRNSGLAWSAGIIFFGAVIFMMIFGWFADLLFGSSPWGLVGGIILGGIIGFIQFFRITSQIFKK